MPRERAALRCVLLRGDRRRFDEGLADGGAESELPLSGTARDIISVGHTLLELDGHGRPRHRSTRPAISHRAVSSPIERPAPRSRGDQGFTYMSEAQLPECFLRTRRRGMPRARGAAQARGARTVAARRRRRRRLVVCRGSPTCCPPL
jgi:hypothetical protein